MTVFSLATTVHVLGSGVLCAKVHSAPTGRKRSEMSEISTDGKTRTALRFSKPTMPLYAAENFRGAISY
jgi:hypothetical protein